MNSATELLKKIGLGAQESRVYLSLLKLEEAQSGKICQETKIASSNIYFILDSLIKKGLISFKMINNKKVFMPSPVETLSELFLEKQKKLEQEKKELQELIKSLKQSPKEENEQSNYKYYQGISGIKGMWHEINSLLKEGFQERIYGGKREAYERLFSFYDEHQKIKNKLGIKAKILFSEEDKDLAIKRKNNNNQIKFSKLNNSAEWGVVEDMVYIQYYLSREPKAFLIKDGIIAETFKEVFDKVWEKSSS